MHYALETTNIVETVRLLRKRGVEFLSIPKAYYDNLEKTLPNVDLEIAEDI